MNKWPKKTKKTKKAPSWKGERKGKSKSLGISIMIIYQNLDGDGWCNSNQDFEDKDESKCLKLKLLVHCIYPTPSKSSINNLFSIKVMTMYFHIKWNVWFKREMPRHHFGFLFFSFFIFCFKNLVKIILIYFIKNIFSDYFVFKNYK